MNEDIHRLNCFVENKPGVLATLSVGPTDDGTVSRMRIDVFGDDRVINQIVLQLRNQVNVIEVTARRRSRKARD